VVDIADMEWFCAECRVAQASAHADIDVATFVSGEGASQQQKQAYLSSLPQPILVSLLLRASTKHPDIPIFAPSSRPKSSHHTSKAPSQPFLSNPPSTAPQNGFAPPSQPPTNPAQPQFQPPPSAQTTAVGPQRPPDLQTDENGDYYTETIGTVYYYDDGTTEEAAPAHHFPRPGHGLAKTLPPEQDDIQWLVDDNFEVYSHIYQTDAKEANEALFGITGNESGNGDANAGDTGEGNEEEGKEKGKELGRNWDKAMELATTTTHEEGHADDGHGGGAGQTERDTEMTEE